MRKNNGYHIEDYKINKNNKNMKKIYCENCKYFYKSSSWRCDECGMFCETMEYDSYQEHHKRTKCKYCEDINENNDCKYYKKKKWWNFG